MDKAGGLRAAPESATWENGDMDKSKAQEMAAKMFETKLTPAEEVKFREWKAKNAPQDSGFDYDLRGAFKADLAGKLPRDGRGHTTDLFKKPNHPTFSDQSQWHGKNGLTGGKWVEKNGRMMFVAGPTNMEYQDPGDLAAYFREQEPDVNLVIPPKLYPNPPIPAPVLPAALQQLPPRAK